MSSTITVSIISSLYRCAQYLDEYFRALSLIEDAESIEVLLLHNDPTDKELELVEQWKHRVSVQVRHVIIPEREGLYATWNRGVMLAQGRYLAVWNVDDQRSPSSLTLQAATLDAHPEAGLCYGNYLGVQQFAAREGTLYEFPEFSRTTFLRSCYLTPFPMWRKCVHDTIGYFDESFRSAGDYDFQVRVARSYSFVKVPALMGWYLEAPESGISKSGDINNIERSVCELRYAMYDKVDLLYLLKAMRYSLNTMRWLGTTVGLNNYFSGLQSYRLLRLALFPLSLLRVPINTARYLKHRLLPGLKARRNASVPTLGLKQS